MKNHVCPCIDCHREVVLKTQDCLEDVGDYLAMWHKHLKDWPRFVPSTCAEFYALEILKTISTFHQHSTRYLNSLSNEQSPRHLTRTDRASPPPAGRLLTTLTASLSFGTHRINACGCRQLTQNSAKITRAFDATIPRQRRWLRVALKTN